MVTEQSAAVGRAPTTTIPEHVASRRSEPLALRGPERRSSAAPLALLTDSLYGSGAERVMLNLAEAFTRRGHPVDFLVCRFDGHFADQVPEGVRLICLAASNRFPAQLRACLGDFVRAPSLIGPALRFQKARHLRALAAYLREERPHALLSANPNPNLLAVWARRLAGVDTRIVLSEHNHLSAQLSRPSKRWKLALEKTYYPLADAVVAVSEGVADDLSETAQIPRERISRIYNPVVDPRLVERSREPVDHPWLREKGPPVVLAVGKLKPRKGFSTLLRAFARLGARREARLILLGEGEERAHLEALAAELGIVDAVDLPGFADNPLAYMARSDVFVLPSEWEGLPTVLIEALLCGCPVVSTD